jgi:hypothetical protein
MDRKTPGAHTLFVMKPALYRVVALGAVLAAVPVQAQNPVFANLVQSRYVHCAFYKAYDVDRATGDHVLVEGRSDTLTHFQGIEGNRARQITTRTAGAREVRVVHSGKYLHFIDRSAGMYVLTTIYDCIDRDRRGICVTYGAMQSRHFDARVLSDPDAVYEALKDSSDPGFCDHSFFGIQEAAR